VGAMGASEVTMALFLFWGWHKIGLILYTLNSYLKLYVMTWMLTSISQYDRHTNWVRWDFHPFLPNWQMMLQQGSLNPSQFSSYSKCSNRLLEMESISTCL
jgi:hypothetical protein